MYKAMSGRCSLIEKICEELHGLAESHFVEAKHVKAHRTKKEKKHVAV